MYIYKTINLINNKIYIGQHSLSKKDYLGSGKILKFAINKYGKENFIKEIIEECNNQKELDLREKYWIKYYNSTDKNIGYNIALGGGGRLGCKHSEKTKKLLSELQRGAKNPNFGKPLSEKQKKSLSEYGKKRIGKKNFFFGKKHTEETKQKISQANSIYVTIEIEGEIINLYKTCGVLAISKKLGLGIKKINNILKKHNIVKRKSGPIKGNKHVRRPATEKTKNKLSVAFSGEKHPMWGIRGRDHPLYKTVSKEITKKAISMYLQGERYQDIQIKLQLSRNKLIKILKESGVKLKGKGNYVRRTKKSGMGNS